MARAGRARRRTGAVACNWSPKLTDAPLVVVAGSPWLGPALIQL